VFSYDLDGAASAPKVDQEKVEALRKILSGLSDFKTLKTAEEGKGFTSSSYFHEIIINEISRKTYFPSLKTFITRIFSTQIS
jgi:hypothetical protein